MHHRSTFHFCQLCRRNVDRGGKGHVFTRGHQASVTRYLDKATKELGVAVDAIRRRPVALAPSDTPQFWCRFCNVEVDESEQEFVCGAAAEHLASPHHSDQVQQFLTQNVPDKSQRGVTPYVLSSVEYQAYLAACRETKAVPSSNTPVTVVTSLTSASSTTTMTTVAVVPLSNKQVLPTTKISPHGIAQNPTGVHEGKRVWGGGIMKLKSAWIPWEVDELYGATMHTPDAVVPAAMTSLANTLPSSPRRPRQTLFASGSSLTYVHVPELAPGEGNVHSGAVPPWLLPSSTTQPVTTKMTPLVSTTTTTSVQPSSEFIGPLPNPVLSVLSSLGRFVDKDSTACATSADMPSSTERTSQREGGDWLPKFGRVWQEGSRTVSLSEFRRDEQHIQPQLSGSNRTPLASMSPSVPVAVQDKALEEQKVLLRKKLLMKQQMLAKTPR